MYGKESGFGQNRRKRNIDGAAGDFQMEKGTARRMGLRVSEKNDERFDLNNSSAAAAKYLKILDNHFRSEIILGSVATIPIESAEERKKFDIAAYNGGDTRIAKAQKLAQKAGNDPAKWDDVKKFLEEAGATKKKAGEIREYVERTLVYEEEFKRLSSADTRSKYRKAAPVRPYPEGRHWITKDGRHILIKD